MLFCINYLQYPYDFYLRDSACFLGVGGGGVCLRRSAGIDRFIITLWKEFFFC